MTSTTASLLAEDVVRDGFDPHQARLTDLLAGAARQGVAELLLDVVADPDEPIVARHRALGRILSAMVSIDRDAGADRAVVLAPRLSEAPVLADLVA